MRFYHYIYLGLFLVAIILAFYHKNKLKGSVLWTLPYFLTLIWLMDVGSLLLISVFKQYNVWLLNLLVNFQLLYIFIIYSFLFKAQRNKWFALVAAFIFEMLFLGSLFWTEQWNTFQELPFFIGSFLQIIVLLLFILELLQSDDFLYIHQYTVFWITIAYLFYWVIPFPISFWLYSFYKYDSKYLLTLSIRIQFIANLFMYACLIFGFLWSKRRYKL